MVSGVQSTSNLPASTWTVMSTGPATANLAQICTISLANRNNSSVNFQLAVNPTGTSTPSATDYLEYNTAISAYNVFERRGIPLYYGQQLMVYTGSSNVTAVAYAMEGSATNLSGIMGRYDLSATTWTQIVSTPTSGRIKVCSVSFANRNMTNVTINLAATTNPSSPATSEYIEYTTTILGYGVLERTGIVISAGYYISAYASASGVSVVGYGIEDTA
jgi:hypothetical protein